MELTSLVPHFAVGKISLNFTCFPTLKQKQSSTTLPLKRAQNRYLRAISGPIANGVSKEIVLSLIWYGLDIVESC